MIVVMIQTEYLILHHKNVQINMIVSGGGGGFFSGNSGRPEIYVYIKRKY